MEGFAVEVDIGLLVFLALAFLLGVFRGAVRQLIALGAFLVTFVVAAYLRPPIADWLAGQQTQFTREYVEMMAFLLAFVVLFSFCLLIIEIGGNTIHLTSRVAVDEILGGLLALGVAVLVLGALVIVLESYYAHPIPGGAEQELIRGLHLAFQRSAIIDALRHSLVPGLLALLGPLLPPQIRAIGA